MKITKKQWKSFDEHIKEYYTVSDKEREDFKKYQEELDKLDDKERFNKIIGNILKAYVKGKERSGVPKKEVMKELWDHFTFKKEIEEEKRTGVSYFSRRRK